MKKNRISKSWLADRKKDKFFQKSKIQGYRSRSAYKLIEMDKRFKFLHKKTNLLDLGSSPGGWSQVADKTIVTGKILAIDIKPMQKINKVTFIQDQFFSNGNVKEFNKKVVTFFNKKIDVVLSDMAANTTGNKNLDSFRTGELCLNAMDLAIGVLTEEGVFLSKVFMGSIFKEIQEKANKCFKQVIKHKPLSSKKESKEIYIYCKGILKV